MSSRLSHPYRIVARVGLVMSSVIITLSVIVNSACACRPFTTEDAGVAGRNIAQIELSYDHQNCGDESDEGTFLFVPIYGVSDRLEVSAELPISVADHVSGVGDILVAGKFLLAQQSRAWPAFATKTFVKTASGDQDSGLGSGVTEYGIAGVASGQYGGLLTDLVLGVSMTDGPESPSVVVRTLGVATQYAFSDHWSLACEVTAIGSFQSEGHDGEASALVGLIHHVSPAVAIDAGFRIGLTSTVPQSGVSFGVSLSQ